MPIARSNSPARALVATLAALWLARAALTFVPTMDAWGLNLQRFLPAAAAWGLWLLGALALVPAVAWRAAPRLERIGRATASGAAGAWAWAAFAAALVLLLPDRTQMTGDFILRQRAVEEGGSPALLFAQALPLDVWLHWTLPRWGFVRWGVPAAAQARAWGAVDAALLAISAVTFARALRFRGAAALAATGATTFSGALALFTGYGKGLVDECVAVVAVAALGARAVAAGRGYLALGAVTALAIALHRAGVLLLPATLAAWGLGVRKHGVSRSALAGLALPLLAAALVGRQVVAIVSGYDVPVHVVPGGGIRRWIDVANGLLVTAPLSPLVPVLVVAYGRSLPRRAEIVPALIAALMLVGVAFAVEPQQGHLRDWDALAPAGTAVALLAAWLAAEVVAAAEPTVPSRLSSSSPRSAPARPARARFSGTAGGTALAVVLAAAAPSLQWLVHLHDVTRGMARVHAALQEPPPRPEFEYGRLWDYLGIRSSWLGDRNVAAAAFARSAAYLPTPRVLGQWARAEIQRGQWTRARDVCRTWTTRAPDDLDAWRTLAATATHLNDRPASREAAEQILRLDPRDPDAPGILDYLERTDSSTVHRRASGTSRSHP